MNKDLGDIIQNGELSVGFSVLFSRLLSELDSVSSWDICLTEEYTQLLLFVT